MKFSTLRKLRRSGTREVNGFSVPTTFSASCRKEQVRHGESVLWRTGSLCSPEAALPSAVVRHSVPWIDLACLLEMFLSQLGHAQVLEPASEHPMVKRIFRS